MIYGKKVRLRAVTRDDLPTFLHWFNDPEVTRFLGGSMWPLSFEDEQQWFERHLAEHTLVLGIETLAAEGQPSVLIGNLSLMDVNERNRNAELGIVLGEKSYWSQGYGRDAITALLHYAFDELNNHRVYLRVYDFNPRGIRCYEACGFQIEGRLRQHTFRNGQWHDEIVMGVLRDEFRQRAASPAASV